MPGAFLRCRGITDMIENGILNVNKPAGWTSQDVCAKLRGRLHIRKIGHTGTLDPMATGVLPVCIGRATRIIEYYDKDYKSYHASMKLGIETDTLDITGEILRESPVRIVNGSSDDAMSVSIDDIRQAFADYTGEIEQIPPKYSALKINGRRAYDLAREGKAVDIKPRRITVLSNEISNMDCDNATVEYDVVCSKGTYIRTICDDIGRTLGCGAVMTSLCRTSNGFFRLEDALELSDIIEMNDEDLESRIIAPEDTLISLGTIVVNDNRVIAYCNGHSSSAKTFRITEETKYDNIFKVCSGDGRFLGIGAVENGELIPVKVIGCR